MTSLDTADTASRPRRAAALVLFALLIAALIARTALLLWEPPFDGSIRYDDIRPLGDAYWVMNAFVGGPGFAVTWVAVAIFIALLARGRAAAVTLAAAAVVGVSGILFAIVIVAEVLPFVFALSHPDAESLFDDFNAQLGILLPAILGTQLAIAVGVLVFLVVALFSRAVPRWFAIAGLVYLVLFAVVPFEALGRATVIAVDIVQVLLLAGIGWFGVRAVRRPA